VNRVKMPPIISKPRKVQKLTVGEKKQILDFMQANPKEKITTVAKIFSERLDKDLNKMRISRIKKDEISILGASDYSKNRVQLKSPNVLKFEDRFYQTLNKQLSRQGAMSYEQVRILCQKVQKSHFQDCVDVAKMKFSQKWWTKLQKDRGITWRRICGNRKTYTCGEVEKEIERVRAIMSTYVERDIYNFDESSFFPEFNGSYSIHSPDVINMPTGNTKRRLTMACFISAAGEMILPTFLDKHVNKTLVNLHQTEPELRGEYKDAKGRTKKFKRRTYRKYEIFFNDSAWVVKDIFHLIIKRFDAEIGRRGRTALLWLDNASCHKIDYTKFKNIRVEYLAANMTGYIQVGI